METQRNYGKLNIFCDNLEDNPCCPHGPTLLFERIKCNGESQKFYSCSAYRSRKICPFFIPYGDVSSKEKIPKLSQKNKMKQKYPTSKVTYCRIKQLNAEERSYCHTCNCLLPTKECSLHKTHDVTKPLSDFLLKHPSQLLHLRTHSKGESQFIFSKNSVDVIVNGLKKLNISKVLCLGTPSIHERVQENVSGIKSVFLDLDDRYKQFYSELEFCWFNMMNFYFFEELKGYEIVKEFLSSQDVALIIDPPFSARTEPLMYTLSRFNSIYQESNSQHLPVIWIFPYFKEDEVLNSFPNMVMLDYDVRYVNQKLFKENKKLKTSVVRIFTNLDSSKFVFPADEGYHFCSNCNRWVSKFNQHCFKCGICPSKNGHPYMHCDFCSRCVKNYWKHCEKCGRCALEKHPCDKWREHESKGKKRKILDENEKAANANVPHKVITTKIFKKKRRK